VGLRAGLDRCGKSRPTGIRSPDCPARRQSLYRLRYQAHYLLCYLPLILQVSLVLYEESRCSVTRISGNALSSRPLM